MPVQTPYPVGGLVTVATGGGAAANVFEGARIYIWDRTEGDTPIAIGSYEGVKVTRTNSRGEYILNIADITSSYSDGDKLRVYCEAGEIITFTDVRIDLSDGANVVNFALTRKSGLKDGITGTVDKTEPRYGLHFFGTGMKKGLKDGLT